MMVDGVKMTALATPATTMVQNSHDVRRQYARPSRISSIIVEPENAGRGIIRMTLKQAADTTKVPVSMMSDHDTPIVEEMTPPTSGPSNPPANVLEKPFNELLVVKCSPATTSGNSAIDAG